MAKKKDFTSGGNPLMDDDHSGLTMAEADAQLYGPTGINIETGTKKPYPTEIDKLMADRTQPRRTVPLSIRDDWDGRADKVRELLRRWHEATEKELSAEVPIAKIFKGYEIGIEVDPKTHPIADKFMSVVNLASGIKREGLINPIQIDRYGVGGKINAGERRWLAHHLLRMFDDKPEQWDTIAAVDVQANVWKQAQENGNRSPLNAIEMARQLALLIMDMYAGDDGVQFDSYDALVSPGGSDRPYYAQVADGRTFNVKRGFYDKILEATGLKSKAQVSQYRNLLNLDNDIWMEADEENWTENYCRVNFLQKPIEDENEGKELTTVNSFENDSPSPAVEIDPISVQIGQVRAKFDDSDLPYLVVEEKWADKYICGIVYENARTAGRLSEGQILSDWQYVLPGVPETAHADENVIKVGQIRARDEDVLIPYLTVKKDIGRGDWYVHITNEYGSHESYVSEKSIRKYWSVLLDAAPEIPSIVKDAIDDEPPSTNLLVGTGYSQTYTPATQTPRKSEMDDNLPEKWRSVAEEEDDWDRPLNPVTSRTPGEYPPLSKTTHDDADNMAFITLHEPEKLGWLIGNWQNMARNMGMQPQLDKLETIRTWTPEMFKRIAAEEGIEAVDAVVQEVDQAVLDIYHEFKARYESLLDDLYSVAEKAAKKEGGA